VPDLNLDAIEARVNAATEGPWQIIGGGEYVTGAGVGIGTADGGIMARDAEFIAHAREDVPALVAEVRRLRQRPSVDDIRERIRITAWKTGRDQARSVLALFPMTESGDPS
jgi:hypothetical protein